MLETREEKEVGIEGDGEGGKVRLEIVRRIKNWKGVWVKIENKRGGRDKGQLERNNGRKGGLRYDGDKRERG